MKLPWYSHNGENFKHFGTLLADEKMQPGLYKGAHMGRMQQPKGFVLGKIQKQDGASRMLKHVIGYPGHV